MRGWPCLLCVVAQGRFGLSGTARRVRRHPFFSHFADIMEGRGQKREIVGLRLMDDCPKESNWFEKYRGCLWMIDWIDGR